MKVWGISKLKTFDGCYVSKLVMTDMCDKMTNQQSQDKVNRFIEVLNGTYDTDKK